MQSSTSRTKFLSVSSVFTGHTVCNDVMLDPLTQQAPLLRNLQSSNQLMEKEQRHQLEQEINFKNHLVQEKGLRVTSQRRRDRGDRPHACASQSESRKKRRKSKLSPGFRSFSEASTVSVTRERASGGGGFLLLVTGFKFGSA
ncbi:hypothetical protein KOW79_013936 [Hemibagrus wyckioides]|uniref:Uncharacterized protein n=1 Tax=Hemibagrus wyckioides TaxID=337641 RepID=A0A9D3NKE9_9TELE|nr:hypothetical protein KOW79_013936 [Hemibagrus wyckioides]